MPSPTSKMVSNKAKHVIIQIRIVNLADDNDQFFECKWPDSAFMFFNL